MRPDTEGWFTRERILTISLAFATLLGLYLCYLIIKPFIAPIAFALALSVATRRPHRWLRKHIKREGVSAAILVIMVALLIVAPVALLGTYVVQQAIEALGNLGGDDAGSKLRTLIERQPYLGSALAWVEARFDLRQQLEQLGGTMAEQGTALLAGSVNFLTQLVIMLFVLFFMYRDESQARASLCRLVPLSNEESGRLFSRAVSTIQAMINGSLTVAAVQAICAGIMYWALDVPASILWAAATFIAALVPVFGTVLVWGPITLYLLITGSFVKAVILATWGVLAVGTIDNVLYPFLVGNRLRMHTVPTFFAIVGGVALFGPAGLILGPMALAITIALLDVWWERTTEGHAAEEAVADDAPSLVPPGAAVRDESDRSVA